MTLIKRYAEGFLDYAAETIGFEKGLEELLDMKSIFRDNPKFRKLLENPSISYAEKCVITEDVFAKNFTEETRNFIKLLIKKERISNFLDIAEYARVKYAHGKEASATLSASYPLDTNVIEAIKNILEQKLHKSLHLYMDLDPGLLGGIKVTIGNMVIDGSVKKRLYDMREKLMAVEIA